MNIYYIIFFTTAVLALFSTGKIKQLNNLFLLLIFCVLVLFAGTRYFIDADYWLYDFIFYQAVTKPVDIFIAANPTLEWCIWLISKFSSLFFSSYKDANFMSFFIFACLGVGIKLFAIAKNNVSVFFAVILYFGSFFMGQEMTTIRAGVAAGIFLWGVKDLENKNDKGFIFKILLALLFHYSSIIFFIVWILLKQKIQLKYFIIATFVSLIFPITKVNILQMLYLDRLIPKVQVYSEIARKGVGVGELNVFNFKIIISFIFLLSFIFFYKKIGDNKKLVTWLKIHCISIIFFFLLSPLQMTFSLRTFELISVIQILLFPSLIQVFPKKFSYIPVLLIIAVAVFQIYYTVDLSGNFQQYQSWLFK